MHQIALTVQRHVLMNHMNDSSFQSMCLKCLPPACTCDIRWSCHWWTPVFWYQRSWRKSN